MKKTNPFKLYFYLIGGFLLTLSLILAIIISVIGYNNSKNHPIFNSVDEYKEYLDAPSYNIHSSFYDMYDAYEYIINNKKILMSEKQQYIIQHYSDDLYTMKDHGTTQVNALYSINREKHQSFSKSYEYHEFIYAGNLYITKSYDYPKGIEFTYANANNRNLSYTVYLTILNIDDIQLDKYVDKIKDYVLLTEKHNK